MGGGFCRELAARSQVCVCVPFSIRRWGAAGAPRGTDLLTAEGAGPALTPCLDGVVSPVGVQRGPGMVGGGEDVRVGDARPHDSIPRTLSGVLCSPVRWFPSPSLFGFVRFGSMSVFVEKGHQVALEWWNINFPAPKVSFLISGPSPHG